MRTNPSLNVRAQIVPQTQALCLSPSHKAHSVSSFGLVCTLKAMEALVLIHLEPMCSPPSTLPAPCTFPVSMKFWGKGAGWGGGQ